MKVNKIIKSAVEEELEITGATLLSIEEAEEYLTESERAYNTWYWLRSRGLESYDALNVYYDGEINRNGEYVDYSDGVVRPVLQIKNLEFSNLEVGDTFEFGGYEFKVISENLAWMHKQDIGQHAFNNDFKKGNDYETSDVKRVVDAWFEDLIFIRKC